MSHLFHQSNFKWLKAKKKNPFFLTLIFKKTPYYSLQMKHFDVAAVS